MNLKSITKLLGSDIRIVDQRLAWIESVEPSERSAMQALLGIPPVIQIDQIQIRIRSNDLFVDRYFLIQPLNIGFVLLDLKSRVCVSGKKSDETDGQN